MLLRDAGDWVEACAEEVAPLVENGIYDVSTLSCTPWEKWSRANPNSSQPPTAVADAADPTPAPPADLTDPTAAVKPLRAVQTLPAVQPLLDVQPLQAVHSFPAPIPAPPQVPEPMGNTKENHSVSLVRMTMLTAASLKGGGAEPKTYK